MPFATIFEVSTNSTLLSPPLPLLEAKEVRCGYERHGSFHAILANVDLRIAEQEVVCLLGASGCGKSTFLTTLGGLQRPDRGEIQFRGNNLSSPHPRIGFVFQKPALLPWLNVRRNVAWSLRLKHSPHASASTIRSRIEKELTAVGLAGSERLWPHQLSGGMAQRVALARTLARDPHLLLLDEPFSALDAITRLEMQKLLLELIERRKVSVVMVTHDIDEALLLGDRVILLGGSPATIVGEWSIPHPKPRFESAQELIPLRCEILAALSRSLSKKISSKAVPQ